MKPYGVDVQISMLIGSAVAFWLGKFVGGLFFSITGYEPRTWLGEALWGIVPAAPFVLAFLFALGLWVYEMIGDLFNKAD